MKNSKRRNLWLTAAIAAAIALLTILNSVAGGLITSGIQQGTFAGLSNWLWVFGGTAAIIAVATFWLGLRATDTGDDSNILSASTEYNSIRRQYLLRITDRFQYLPLRGVDYNTASAETGEDERLKLSDIYIQLNTTTQQRMMDGEVVPNVSAQPMDRTVDRMEMSPLSVLNALVETPRMVLLGDPGGGKSTFVNHLAFCLASHELEADRRWLERLDDWPEQWRQRLPVPIILRDVAAWFQRTQSNQRRVGLFHAYLKDWLVGLGLEDFQDLLEQHLGDGTALLLLDGLDEVPLVDDVLERIKAMIADLPNAYRNTTILVTCRVLSYQDDRWQLNSKEWTSFELDKLNEAQIDGFIQAWHSQLAVVNAVTNPEALNVKLSQAVRRPDLIRLAQNPLLLTVMALVHTHKGELPDARSVLYEDVVDLLLWRWEAQKHEDKEGNETTWRQLLQSAQLTDEDVKETLWQLAYEAHAKASSGNDNESTADIAEQDLLDGLRALHPEESRDWAALLVELMKLRAGLLVENSPRVYTFPHRTFQEYLAGCHLSQHPDFVPKSVKLAKQGAYWREAIRLAVGRLVHHNRDIDKSLILVSELCPTGVPDEADESGWRQVGLAGECLLEIGVARAARRHQTGRELVERVPERLSVAMTIDALEPRERVEIGNVLSRIGDPRDLDELIPIRADTLTMGTSDAEEEEAVRSQMSVESFTLGEDRVRSWIKNEKPQHTVKLADFSIAKYPMTNGQYEAFVNATDHKPPQHWQGKTVPLELRNHPVVYVSWHDAVAYCTWLTATKGAEDGKLYRLPSEAEWEMAARGTDKRLYPWGNEFDATKCNASETAINGTSTVGLLLQGASPFGCLDMAGNVDEWCSTERRDYPHKADDGRESMSGEGRCVLRGGAFYSHRSTVRCASRFSYVADDLCNYVGFRCASPGC